jgi:hypothetical protein
MTATAADINLELLEREGGEDAAFTLKELREAVVCVHSSHHPDCASCIRHEFWYRGRIAGLEEVAGLLATNSAIKDALKHVVEPRR